MRWRRTAAGYGETPIPATPYQKAEQLWDERIGSARVQAGNWRLMAFGCLALAAVVIGDDIRARSRSTVTPFVVQVDHLGSAQAIAPAAPDYQPSDQQIAYFLGRFITNVRGLSVDPAQAAKLLEEAVSPEIAKLLRETVETAALPLQRFETGRYVNLSTGRLEGVSAEASARVVAAREKYIHELRSLEKEIHSFRDRGEKIEHGEVEIALKMTLAEWAAAAKVSELFGAR